MEYLLQRLTLRNLRLIRAIAGCGQLSLAAQQLSMTQPAASRSLGEIENLIGDALFLRHPGGMEPTPLGEVLIRHTYAVLGQLENALGEVEAFRQGTSGTVRVGAVTGSAVRFVVPAIQKLKAQSRSATISVDVAPSEELLMGIAGGEFDIALCRPSAEGVTSDLQIDRGRVEVLRVVARADHPLQDKKKVSFADLQDLTWVIQRAGLPIRDTVTQAFINRNLTPPSDTVDTPSLLMALSYLESSNAVAAITEEVADLVATDLGKWRVLAIEEDVVMSPYSLLVKRSGLMNPICMRLHALLRAELLPNEAT